MTDLILNKLFSGDCVKFYLYYIGPPNQLGGKFQTSFSLDPGRYPNTAYEYLIGEGRICEAPQTQYDIPVTKLADAENYDELEVFNGALNRYN